MNDPFDVEKFRWRSSGGGSDAGPGKKVPLTSAKTRRQSDFYKMPMSWHDALESVNAGGKTWAIAGRVLHADFRARGQWFKFPNVKLKGRVSHDTKNRAIELFERLGLIEVQQKGNGKSPTIRLLVRH